MNHLSAIVVYYNYNMEKDRIKIFHILKEASLNPYPW